MNSKTLVITALYLLVVCSGALAQSNAHYPVNSAPLKQTKFVTLPMMTVLPHGWLQDQLEVMANGITGHLFETNDNWVKIQNSQWRGGSGDHWESGPYYCDGLFPLAWLLNDERLKTESRRWIDVMLEHRVDWFDNEAGNQI
jgi:hypothetical protein